MNWIERLYEIKNKDLYSQNGEGWFIEFILLCINTHAGELLSKMAVDIGCGPDGMYLSNSRHMKHLGWSIKYEDVEIGREPVTVDNILSKIAIDPYNKKIVKMQYDFISIDIDGNDFWIVEEILSSHRPLLIVAEFNPAFLDSRTIAYNPDHVWDGTHYYGFSFEAGKKLAEKHGYKVIFQLADMNMFMVRADLIEGLTFPEVTFKQNNFFEESKRTDWVMV